MTAYKNPASINFPDIKIYVEKYQDPRQADAIMRVQQELDETKIILHKTIESVLQRGEKINDLVDRSNALSAQSKMFYKTAKKVCPMLLLLDRIYADHDLFNLCFLIISQQNSCCLVM